MNDRTGQDSGLIAQNDDRKRRDDALRESEERLRLFIQHAPVALAVFDTNMNYITASRRWMEDYGLNEDPAGRNHYDIFPEIPQRWKEIHRRCLSGAVERVDEDRFERADGNVQWLKWEVLPWKGADGAVGGIIIFTEDISDRKRSEEALRESQALFHTVTEGSPDPVFVKDRQSRMLFGNSAVLQVWNKTLEDVVGKNDRELYEDPAVGEAIMRNDRAVLESGVSQAIEEIVQLPSGEYKTFLSTKTPYRDGNGEIIGILGIARDITDRKRTEEALRESENNYRALFNNMSEGFALHQMLFDDNHEPCDYRYIAVNDGFERQTGLKREDLIGRTVLEVLPATEQSWIETFGKVALTGEPVRFEGYSSELNKWYDVYAFSPMKDQFAVLCADITDRKQAEQEVARSHAEAQRRAAELESFFAGAVDAMLLFNPEGKVLLANKAIMKLVGAPKGMPADKWAPQHELYTLDGQPVAREDYPSVRAIRGLETRDARFKMVTPWAESFVSINGNPVMGPNGQVVGGTLSMRDIAQIVETDRRKDELYDRERNIAEVLQQAILPEDVPKEILGYNIAVKYRPALQEAEIGGDFYDVFDLGGGRFGIVIGDVVGKGLAAAMRVAAARHSIRSYAYLDPRPSVVLSRSNDALCKDGDDVSQLLTLFYAVVDPGMGGMMYSSAGHEPPVVNCAREVCDELERGGLPLGLVPGASYEQSSRRLDPGDIVVMVTDGITEARAPGAVLFGKESLVEFVRRHREESPEQIATGLMESATAHAGGQLQDDAAVVVFSATQRRTGK